MTKLQNLIYNDGENSIEVSGEGIYMEWFVNPLKCMGR